MSPFDVFLALTLCIYLPANPAGSAFKVYPNPSLGDAKKLVTVIPPYLQG